MKVVVGLGNPGKKYENTRHNVGFEVVAELARRHGGGKPQRKFEAELVEVLVGSERVLLVAPETFMNLSGRSVRQVTEFFKLALDDLLVICDDLNLRLGQLRLRRGGSGGGQNGLKNIIDQLGTQDVPRLRIGIDRAPERVDPADYVLSRFWKEQRAPMDDAVVAAANGVECWVERGIDAAMNLVNVSDSNS
ncbi:MAG: aminoacyl-tRNA hydrolase [Planctomycetaceae bacterium]|nr:aminoacyl-tRNA hydrolase [Planctomycetaceae bacterium]